MGAWAPRAERRRRSRGRPSYQEETYAKKNTGESKEQAGLLYGRWLDAKTPSQEGRAQGGVRQGPLLIRLYFRLYPGPGAYFKSIKLC